ncbi:hypothetical protein [Dendronalium sp. ChiSLP03b]|uniref:hypothetical protein n=1 Tax=Dendronalium sp. ChiSLP03b TaxID=3075381 RepID=UPI002AD38709|nr:hypothetical protein [Dendronalium sp. ChiSLP03b]MDZ8206011.1 hypothetical protein [Dendronalium sp. ChiSLP03b]
MPLSTLREGCRLQRGEPQDQSGSGGKPSDARSRSVSRHLLHLGKPQDRSGSPSQV